MRKGERTLSYADAGRLLKRTSVLLLPSALLVDGGAKWKDGRKGRALVEITAAAAITSVRATRRVIRNVEATRSLAEKAHQVGLETGIQFGAALAQTPGDASVLISDRPVSEGLRNLSTHDITEVFRDIGRGHGIPGENIVAFTDEGASTDGNAD